MTILKGPTGSGFDEEVDYPPSLGDEEKEKGLEGSLPLYVVVKDEGVVSIL